MNTLNKRTFLALATLLLASPSLWAQNCKFDEEKKDPFSNGMTRKSAHHIGPVSWNWLLTFTQAGNQHTMDLRVVLGAHLLDVIEKGNILFLKLEDGTIIRLPALEQCNPTHLVSQGVIWTNYIPKYSLDAETIAKMGQSPITDLKIKIGTNDYLLPKITARQTAKIMTTIKCMSQ